MLGDLLPWGGYTTSLNIFSSVFGTNPETTFTRRISAVAISSHLDPLHLLRQLSTSSSTPTLRKVRNELAFRLLRVARPPGRCCIMAL